MSKEMQEFKITCTNEEFSSMMFYKEVKWCLRVWGIPSEGEKIIIKDFIYNQDEKMKLFEDYRKCEEMYREMSYELDLDLRFEVTEGPM